MREETAIDDILEKLPKIFSGDEIYRLADGGMFEDAIRLADWFIERAMESSYWDIVTIKGYFAARDYVERKREE